MRKKNKKRPQTLRSAVEGLEELRKAAMKGPYSVCGVSEKKCQCGFVWGDGGKCLMAVAHGPNYLSTFGDPWSGGEMQTANQHFIAESLNWLPKIIRELKKVKKWK